MDFVNPAVRIVDGRQLSVVRHVRNYLTKENGLTQSLTLLRATHI